MTPPEQIAEAVERHFSVQTPGAARMGGLRALVTSGPTHEPIDPVRYITNHSSGRQGHAIAEVLAALGAETTLVSGPVDIPDPMGVNTVHVTTAREMMEACVSALPVDIAICAAAVSDWRVRNSPGRKLKKAASEEPPQLELTENPDILASLAGRFTERPRLVVGFAAETDTVIPNARDKLERKGCDWIIANDVSQEGVMGGDRNTIRLIARDGIESWPTASKQAVADRLVERIVDYFTENTADA